MNGDKLAEARQAIAYSRNFATAKPDIGATEREHILGLCDVLSGIIAAHSAQGVGDGWVLVPRDATSAMMRAGMDAALYGANPPLDWQAASVACIWTAMLGASALDAPIPANSTRDAEIAKAAARYEWLRKRVNYGENDFQMTVATLYWEVDAVRLAPGTLDEAIDAAMLAAPAKETP